jgi:hypothetical protein
MVLAIGVEPINEVIPAEDQVIVDIFLSGLMLYPEDDKIDARRRFMLAAASEYIGLVNDRHCHSDEQDANVQFLAQYQNILVHTLILNSGGFGALSKTLLMSNSGNFSKNINSRRMHGMYSGYIFTRTLPHELSASAIASITATVFQTFDGGRNGIHVEKMWLNEDSFRSNIWRVFSKVVHLWAALLHFDTPTTYGQIPVIRFNELRLLSGEACESPLLELLALSEMYLEKVPTRSGHGLLINKEQSLRPSFFSIPD